MTTTQPTLSEIFISHLGVNMALKEKPMLKSQKASDEEKQPFEKGRRLSDPPRRSVSYLLAEKGTTIPHTGRRTRSANTDKHFGKVDIPNSDDSPKERARYKSRRKKNQTDEEQREEEELEDEMAKAREQAREAEEKLKNLEKERKERKSKAKKDRSRAALTKTAGERRDTTDGGSGAYAVDADDAHSLTPMVYASDGLKDMMTNLGSRTDYGEIKTSIDQLCS